MSPTSISVVVASNNARSSVEECLNSILQQSDIGDVELIVVDNSTDGTAEILRERFSAVCVFAEPSIRLIPELWANGIRRSSGAIVALTTAHCVPGPGWLDGICRAHADPAAGVGGAIESHPSARLPDWAVYFCRYSRFMLPFEPRRVMDVAADNASYKRTLIDQCSDTWSGGVWGPQGDAALPARGGDLIVDPSIVVFHKRSFPVGTFVKLRFLHGSEFGSQRARRLGTLKRIAYIAISPAIPFVYLARIGREVLRKRRHIGPFVLAMPVLCLFLLAWSLGESCGAIRRSR